MSDSEKLQYIEDNFVNKSGPNMNGNFKFDFIKGQKLLWGKSFSEALDAAIEREPNGKLNAKK